MKRKLLLVLVTLLPMLACAYDAKINGIYYNFSGDEAEVTYLYYYDGNYVGSVTIPASVTYNSKTYSVTRIGEYAFCDCSVTSITIPNSVTSIGEWAFIGCTDLTSIKVETGNTKYDSRNNCNAIIETATNTLIAGCQTTIIPNSVTSIDWGAFWNCSSLTSINIPNSVTSIGEGAFFGCYSLTSVTIGNSVTSIGNYAFFECSSLTSLIIPNSVTSIGDYAFRDCSSLTSVTIGNSVTSIGEEAFRDCSSLTSVTIGNSVTSIGDYAFEDCTSLTSITIPNSVTSIGYWAFYNCNGLTSVTIGNGVTSIGEDSFGGCTNITSLSLDCENVSNWFNNSEGSLRELLLGDNVKSIGDYAFSDCSSLTSIKVETGNTKYDSRNNCNAIIETATNKLITGCQNTIIPNSVTSIGEFAFYDCSGLTSVTIGNSVTSIGEYAFYGCSGLTSITIPNSVTSIGDYAFSDCSSLTSIKVETGNTKYDSRNNCNAIIETATNRLIAGCQNTIIPNSVTVIGRGAFLGCSGLTSVTIPNSVILIGGDVFRGCYFISSSFINKSRLTDKDNWGATICDEETSDGLLIKDNIVVKCRSWVTVATIPEGVTSIGSYAFKGCSSLTSITIPNSVTSIGYSAFYNCSSLTSINIPNSVTSIGRDAFYGCSGLKKVIVPDIAAWCAISFGNVYANPLYLAHHLYSDETTEITDLIIPNSVTSIGWSAFSGCSSLTSVTIGGAVTSIGSSAFSGCSSLTSITIPNSVTSIGEYAFHYCSSLTSITIGSGVTSIGSVAFEDCTSLKDVYCLAESVPQAYFNAFYNSPISSATLYVPESSIDMYKTTKPWSGFGTIVGLSQDMIDGIGEVESSSQSSGAGGTKLKVESSVYDLSGRQIVNGKLSNGQMPRGINIIRLSDGTTRKVLIK